MSAVPLNAALEEEGLAVHELSYEQEEVLRIRP
jgi:hypothetical protein